jgi:uncharacterized membrane protein YbhN (UPF0104 family)
MKAFPKWGVIIAASGYLILATYMYLIRTPSITHITRIDLFQAFGVIFSVLAIYRAASWLIANHRQSRYKGSPRFEEKKSAHEVKLPIPKTQSFETALGKKPRLLIFVLVFFFSLPLLFRWGSVKANGSHFTPHDWFVVAIGEALMTLVLTIGWYRAKRKYEKVSGRR